MSEHRIAWTLHNFEMEQTIIRLRNTRNRLLDRNNWKFPGAEAIGTYRDEIRRLERENASLADRLSGAELERDKIGAELELELNKTEQFLKIADEDHDTLRDYVWFLEREAGEVATQKAMEAFNNRTKE